MINAIYRTQQFVSYCYIFFNICQENIYYSHLATFFLPGNPAVTHVTSSWNFLQVFLLSYDLSE